jgi:hypothetical protein
MLNGMPTPRLATMWDTTALIFAAVLPALVGCALPVIPRTATAAARTALSPTDSVGAATLEQVPIVQIREYSHSPTVTILAWAADEPAFGLRAQLRRDGSLVSAHRLYVSTYYNGVSLSNLRSAPTRLAVVQTVAPPQRLLQSMGISRDVYACFYGIPCSPFEMREVRVPDALLRTNRDSVAVRFYGNGGTELIITVRREVIDPYLAAVDSVATSLRKKYYR